MAEGVWPGIILWGAGGHGRVVLDIALAHRGAVPITFCDDDETRERSLFCGFPVVAARRLLSSIAGGRFVVAIGDNRLRARRFDAALEACAIPVTLVHPSAIVSPSAVLGPGTVVMPRAVINAGAEVGRNCIVNTGAIVEHDCRIGEHAHIAPGVALGGGVRVGAFAQVGIGAVVLPYVEVGAGAFVGAGGVVVKDLPPSVTAAGVPARILHRQMEGIQ
jgi:sugar O-acyltransferase (sialic acid O-acetyltransferase NeuD family)